MCFVEYNWTACCWQFRIGDSFTDFRGTRSCQTLDHWREIVEPAGCCLVRVNSTLYELKAAIPARD